MVHIIFEYGIAYHTVTHVSYMKSPICVPNHELGKLYVHELRWTVAGQVEQISAAAINHAPRIRKRRVDRRRRARADDAHGSPNVDLVAC